MLSSALSELWQHIEALVGQFRLAPYADHAEDGHGTSFRIRRVPAIFSVHTQEGTLPAGTYDVQVESDPPGDYLYTAILGLPEVLELVRIIVSCPEAEWPT